MLFRLCAIVLLAGCTATAHADQIGREVGFSLFSSIKIYQGDIRKKYRVIKKVSFRTKQRAGAAYFDDNTVAAALRRQAQELGADAVIKFQSYYNQGEKQFGFLTGELGYVGGSGIAVKFVK